MHNQRENRRLMKIVKQNRFKNLGELHKEWTEAGVKSNHTQTCQGIWLQLSARTGIENLWCMGMIRRPWWSEAKGQIWPGCQGYTPTLCFEGHPWIFNDHRELEPWFNISSEGRSFLQYSVLVTILGRQDPHRLQGEHPLLVSLTPLPAATYFSQEVSHPGTDQAQPCLASVGNRWVI